MKMSSTNSEMIKKATRKQSLLWKATNIDTGKASYIFGTVHLRDSKVFFLIDQIKSLIDICDIFIAEYNLDDSGESEIMKALQMPGGKHVKDHLDTRKFKKIHTKILKAFNLDIEKWGFLKPMVIENMITESLFETDYEHPMDFDLWQHAKNNGKITIGAESTKSQISIMNNLPIREQIRSLIGIAKNTYKFKKKIKKTIDLYEQQKISQLYRSAAGSLGKMKKTLVYERNNKIAKKMLKYADESAVFVAVGAGHLSGRYGILRIIRQNGFTLKPIYLNANV
jgi:uncharacterized protein YbaP (TraB family)